MSVTFRQRTPRTGQHDDQHQSDEVIGAADEVVGRDSTHTFMHRHRHLVDRQSVVVRDEQRLDGVGEIRARILGGEEFDRCSTECSIATCGVSDRTTNTSRQHRRKKLHADPTAGGDPVGPRTRSEPRPDHDVGAGSHCIETRRRLERIVLPIGIDLHGDRIAPGLGVPESGAKSGTHAQIERVSDDRGPCLTGHRRSAIAGAIVDDEHIGTEISSDISDDRGNGLLLIQRRDDDDHTGPHRAPSLVDQPVRLASSAMPTPRPTSRAQTVAPDRVIVIMPAFNEQEALPSTLAGLLAALLPLDVVVIDDGSSDDTAAIAAENGAICLSLPFNLGIGGALRTGFRFAVERGYQRGIQFDADGQHDASQIAALLAPLAEGADMVVGSRFAGAGDYQVGRSRGFAMNILRWSIRRLAGQRFTDTSSGFRSFGPEALSLFATEYPIEYMDSVEALVMACRAGLDVREVPTVMHERTGGVASNRSIRLAYHYIRVLVSLANTPKAQRRPRPTESPT